MHVSLYFQYVTDRYPIRNRSLLGGCWNLSRVVDCHPHPSVLYIASLPPEVSSVVAVLADDDAHRWLAATCCCCCCCCWSGRQDISYSVDTHGQQVILSGFISTTSTDHSRSELFADKITSWLNTIKIITIFVFAVQYNVSFVYRLIWDFGARVVMTSVSLTTDTQSCE